MAHYAEIVAIEIPESANEGDEVHVVIKVKNLEPSGAITIAVTGLYDYVNPLPQPPILQVPALQIGAFPTSFIMPNKDTAIHVGSWYKSGGEYVQDDLAETIVPLTVEEPPTPPPPPSKIPWGALAVIGGLTAVGIVVAKK